MPLIHLEPDPQNVRGKMSGIDELADSIRAHGIIQPLVVAAIGAGRYRIIAGHRRYEAAKLAGLAQVPTIVRETSAEETREVQLIENVQREDLPAIDVAEALKTMLAQNDGDTEALAKRIGKSSSWVRRHLSLLKLDQKVLVAIRREGLRFEQAARAAQVFKKDGLTAALDVVRQLSSGAMSAKPKDAKPTSASFAHKQRFASPNGAFRAEIIVETSDELDEIKEGQVRSILSALECAFRSS
ncbi:MAG: ParB/RepB/Spo0J family partition protein [Deltaproteobacteria bacterium]|nr:ParB/RepB/Spo0J family partition protein [Deltaproteobacteria bacterium]